jgi:hypothetical protein
MLGPAFPVNQTQHRTSGVGSKETIMARLRSKGPSATRLVRDDDMVPLPIMPWGTVHNVTATETTAARNATAIAADCGVVSSFQAGGFDRHGDHQRRVPAGRRMA